MTSLRGHAGLPAAAGEESGRALAAALVTVVFWASAFVGIRDAGEHLSPGPLALGRLLVGCVVLGTVNQRTDLAGCSTGRVMASPSAALASDATTANRGTSDRPFACAAADHVVPVCASEIRMSGSERTCVVRWKASHSFAPSEM